MSALDWMAVAAEEHGREIVGVYLKAIEGGDWRAAEALMNRIYGKPEEALVTRVDSNPVAEAVRKLSLEEKLELLQRLRAGELVGATPVPDAVLVTEAHVPGALVRLSWLTVGTHTPANAIGVAESHGSRQSASPLLEH